MKKKLKKAIKSDVEIWKMVRNLLKTLHKKDELGFCIKGSHYIIRKGDFSE